MKELLRAARIAVAKPGDNRSEGSMTSNTQTSTSGSLTTPANASYNASGNKTWGPTHPDMLNPIGSMSQPLSSGSLQQLQQTMQIPGLVADPNGGQGLSGLPQAPPMDYSGGAMSDPMFAGQDAWAALAQMPFPFPWNWQDLPFDMMQDNEPYRQ